MVETLHAQGEAVYTGLPYLGEPVWARGRFRVGLHGYFNLGSEGKVALKGIKNALYLTAREQAWRATAKKNTGNRVILRVTCRVIRGAVCRVSRKMTGRGLREVTCKAVCLIRAQGYFSLKSLAVKLEKGVCFCLSDGGSR